MPVKSIQEVRKRDNRIVPFDDAKITDAIFKALQSVGQEDRARSEELSSTVAHFLEETIQGDLVLRLRSALYELDVSLREGSRP